MLHFRIIKPTDADRTSCDIVHVRTSDTILDLQQAIKSSLNFNPNEEDVENFECNCTLARQVAEGPSPPDQFWIIHGKTVVEKVLLSAPTEAAMKQALGYRFGLDLEQNKRVTVFGEIKETSSDAGDRYTKTPVVSVCSKQRHIPVQARPDFTEPGPRAQALDLHTFEMPIHPACYRRTVQESGLGSLGVNGVVDIFVVPRTTRGRIAAPATSKLAIFRDRSHWEPTIVQSDRGMAMFLSSLRVFASNVQDMADDEAMQDAVFHVFDRLTSFPPALRCLYILAQGRTPSAPDCSALSQTIFTFLAKHFLVPLVDYQRSRLFEFSRLFFAFVLETARSFKSSGGSDHSYLKSFEVVNLRDYRTTEPVYEAFQTADGLVEESFFKAFLEGGVLAESHLQSLMLPVEFDSALNRYSLLSGGTVPDLTVFSMDNLAGHTELKRDDGAQPEIDLELLSDLDHLAGICGRNRLAVHTPSQLASSVAPCLTFDRNAHLAVYTEEEPCGRPGQSSVIFRPQHGEETISPSVLEQLIAPIIKTYEEDGTAIFDAMGGAELKKLQEPDEILVFCVDSSQSMETPTDFHDVNENQTTSPQSVENMAEQVQQSMVPAPRHSLGNTTDMMLEYEGFHDMISIIAEAQSDMKYTATRQVMEILTKMLASDIIDKCKSIDTYSFYGTIREAQNELMALRMFYNSLETFREPLEDFLRYHSSTLPDGPEKWKWSFADPVPAEASQEFMPAMPPRITEIPYDLKCPISHGLMLDAVKASDNQTYSRAAVSHWFAMHQTSPMHGANVENTELQVNGGIRRQAEEWINGFGILRATNDAENLITVTWNSRDGSFRRTIAMDTSLEDLYKLAFRGMAGKFDLFQLVAPDQSVLVPSSSADVRSAQLKDGDHITIRIPEETRSVRTISRNGSSTARTTTSDMYLVKVYDSITNSGLFGYWVRRDTKDTLAAVIWKYWRHQLQRSVNRRVDLRQCWVSLDDGGDGWYRGDRRNNADTLAQFFTPGYCTGRLGPETVFKNSKFEHETVAPHSSPSGNVFKVMVSKGRHEKRESQLSRLDVLKQMFEALINRMVAYNYNTHVGLVSFASKAEIFMPVSHVLENFRRATTELRATGDTALWDALDVAANQIQDYEARYAGAKKRIIVISDGLDTKSKDNSSHSICSKLLRQGISVDSICLGSQHNQQLMTVSHLLGSYCFVPTSLENAMAICEMEPFLSLVQRPEIRPRAPAGRSHQLFAVRFFRSMHRAFPTMVDNDTLPPIRQHKNLCDDFVELKNLAGKTTGPPTQTQDNSRTRRRMTRLMTEMKTIATSAHAKRDIYVSVTDMSFWKIVMQGPDDSPYSEGTFLLYLHADEGFPTFAPKARFITKIKHPNVNPHGKVCHSVSSRPSCSTAHIRPTFHISLVSTSSLTIDA